MTRFHELYNLTLFHNYNKKKRELNVLGWIMMMGYDENSNAIRCIDLESRAVGGHCLIEGVRYRIKHKVPVSYFFPEEKEEEGFGVYDVAEIEGTLNLENFFAAGPELLDTKFVLVSPNDSAINAEISAKRTLLVLCLEDKVESIID